MTTDKDKGTNRALAGAGLQAVLSIVCLGVWLAAGGKSTLACTVLIACGVLVWLVAAMIFYCRGLAQAEQIELQALRDAAEKGTVFEGITQDKPAEARLAFVNKWISPIFTLIWAGILAGTGLWLISSFGESGSAMTDKSASWGLVLLAAAFGGFLYSRLCTGLAGRLQWRLLRSAASYMLVCVVSLLLVCTSLFFWTYSTVDMVLAYVLACVQVVLAAELIVNLILDIYRPRMPGREERPSFDSRLFNLLAEPQRVGHSIAETLNYQFGFEVSKTWFYQLCSKAVAPLVVLGAVLLFLVSSLVVVDAGTVAMVYHLGKLERDANGEVRLMQPGLNLKWPWPIDTVQHYPDKLDQSLELGVGDKREKEGEEINGKTIILWAKEHGKNEELNFLLAVPDERLLEQLSSQPAFGLAGIPQSQPGQNKPPPFNVIKLSMVVQYNIKDVQAFARATADPKMLLELAANREMIRYCASATLDKVQPGVPADRPQAILTSGLAPAAAAMKQRVQQEADRLGLGVEITYVGAPDAHPPSDVANAFDEITAAERAQEAKRYQAQGEANKTLANVMGDPAKALELALDIRMLEEFGNMADLKTQPQNLTARLDEEIGKVRRNIVTLDSEIKRDIEMGLASAGGNDDKQRLRLKYQGYLDTLLKIQSGDPAGYDYSADIQGASAAVSQAMRPEALTGEPAMILAQAVAYRWTKDLNERAFYNLFSLQLDAYLAGRELYKIDRTMDVLEEVLPGITKYVLGVDRNKLQLWLNLEMTTSALEAIEPGVSK